MKGPALGPIRLLQAPFRVDRVLVRVSPSEIGGDRLVNGRHVGHSYVPIADRVPVQLMVEDGHYDVRIEGAPDFFHRCTDEQTGIIPKSDIVFRGSVQPEVDWLHVTAVLALGMAVLLALLLRRRRTVPVVEAAPGQVNLKGELQRGTALGPYRVLSLIERGGMGAVYEVEDQYGDHYAMKLPDWRIRQQEPRLRFAREVETLKQLRHRNVVRLYDFSLGDDDTPAWMVLELVDGVPMHELMAKGLSLAELLPLIRDVLEGLGYGHSRGVVHRDVKPENVLVTRDRVAKLTDYGIARRVDQATITAPDRALGTPSYMAPEQMRTREIDPRADLYAVGVLLYHSLARRLPFDGEDPMELLYQKHTITPMPPSRFAPVPPAVDALVLKALARSVDDRFQSAEAFIAALDELTPPG